MCKIQRDSFAYLALVREGAHDGVVLEVGGGDGGNALLDVPELRLEVLELDQILIFRLY